MSLIVNTKKHSRRRQDDHRRWLPARRMEQKRKHLACPRSATYANKVPSGRSFVKFLGCSVRIELLADEGNAGSKTRVCRFTSPGQTGGFWIQMD